MCASACEGKAEGDSPYPGVSPERIVGAEMHHGPVTGNTWTVSRLHHQAVRAQLTAPGTFFSPRSSWLPLRVPPAHSQLAVSHCWTPPIQARSSDEEAPLCTPPSKLLTFNGAMLKVELHSTIKSNEFQKTNKNSNKGRQ